MFQHRKSVTRSVTLLSNRMKLYQSLHHKFYFLSLFMCAVCESVFVLAIQNSGEV